LSITSASASASASASGNTLPAQASSKNGNELLEKKISAAIEILIRLDSVN
jgi:hypothetical protein